jgi:hypothetical protein
MGNPSFGGDESVFLLGRTSCSIPLKEIPGTSRVLVRCGKRVWPPVRTLPVCSWEPERQFAPYHSRPVFAVAFSSHYAPGIHFHT